MKRKKKTITRKARRTATRSALPPHSWEAHPPTRSGEASKTFQVLLISLAVIILLVIIFFTFKAQVVGKAFFTAADNTAGIPDEGSVSTNTAFSRTVRARIQPGGETLAVSFTLSLPAGVTCAGVQSFLGWEQGVVLDTAECVGNQVNFEYASINPNDIRTGTFDVARITFNGIADPETYTLDFTSFNIINLNDATIDFIGEALDPEIIVTGCSLANLAVCTEQECVPAGGKWNVALPQCVQCLVNGDCPAGQNCVNNACVQPGCVPQAEVCDGLDNDCDGQVDDNIAVTASYPDQDEDGYGDTAATPQQGCPLPAGFVVNSRDCNDNNADISPDENEICDNLDNNCDGTVDGFINQQAVCNTKQRCGSFSNACEADEFCQNGQCREMIVTSEAFSHLNSIPDKYTCNGVNVNPPLTISNLPSGTTSLALVMEDLDYKPNNVPFVHWAVLNIPVTAGAMVLEIPENAALAGVQKNDVNAQKKYAGPCPPSTPSKETHHYRFKVYALNTPPTLQTAAVSDAGSVVRTSTIENTLKNNILLDDVLQGVYYPRSSATVSVTEAKQSGARGGGGRVGWDCGQWSACNATKQQKRSCTDMFRPEATKVEVQTCAAISCQESWSCTSWSACSNGQQSRTCTEAKKCGTILQRPALQQSCVVTAPAAPPKPTTVVSPPSAPMVSPPVPPKPTTVVQPPLVKAPAVQKPISVPAMIKNVWPKYKVYVVAVPATLLIIITLILLVHHFRKPKVVYNTEELKQWIKAEKAMGTGDEQVKAILAQNTGWSKEEVEKAMSDALPSAASSVTSVIPPASSLPPGS